MNRSLVLVFAGLLVLLQYPLWFGKGGWLRAWDLDRQVEAQARTNEGLKRRNAGLEAEVKDLKNGLEAIEERARFELGMVKDNEVFFQILETAPAAPASASPTAPATK
jgi:cell division protein FtsB